MPPSRRRPSSGSSARRTGAATASSRRKRPEPASRPSSASATKKRASGRGEPSGRSRRGKAAAKDQKTLLFGGIGLGVIALILLAVVLTRGESSTEAAISQPTVEPYSGEAEAKQALARAEELFRQGTSQSGATRNASYKEALHICKRIDASPVSDSLKSKAGVVRYNAAKHQTF